ncbi:hypothetical protein BDW62DRAFT_218594 [Aspergillus aurantiobrunneus]
MSIYENIAATRERHSQILSDLAAVDRAPDALKSHDAYLSDLRDELAEINRDLAEARKHTQIEREKHERYRDSTVRRLMYRATGKRANFEERADKEMRDYYSAWERENETKAQKEMLEAEIAEAVGRQKELQQACNERALLGDELEAMYRSLFEGPTEEFPEEDAQEEVAKIAQQRYRELSRRLEHTHRAAQCLAKAQLTIKQALLAIFEGIRQCERDKWGFCGLLADMQQQTCLSQAQQRVSQTQMLVKQAMRLDCHVHPLPAMDIVQHDMISGLIFDSMWYNISLLNRVQQSFNEVQHAEQVLGTQLRRTKSRAADLQEDVGEAAATHENAQRELRRIREQAFLQAAEPPPPYTEKTFESTSEASGLGAPPGP